MSQAHGSQGVGVGVGWHWQHHSNVTFVVLDVPVSLSLSTEVANIFREMQESSVAHVDSPPCIAEQVVDALSRVEKRIEWQELPEQDETHVAQYMRCLDAGHGDEV